MFSARTRVPLTYTASYLGRLAMFVEDEEKRKRETKEATTHTATRATRVRLEEDAVVIVN